MCSVLLTACSPARRKANMAWKASTVDRPSRCPGWARAATGRQHGTTRPAEDTLEVFDRRPGRLGAVGDLDRRWRAVAALPTALGRTKRRHRTLVSPGRSMSRILGASLFFQVQEQRESALEPQSIVD